jgi:hypothetical protein
MKFQAQKQRWVIGRKNRQLHSTSPIITSENRPIDITSTITRTLTAITSTSPITKCYFLFRHACISKQAYNSVKAYVLFIPQAKIETLLNT